MYSSALLVVLTIALSAAAHAEPGAPIDYSKLAFYPEKWKASGFEMKLVPWPGDRIVFLTATAEHDAATMTAFVGSLDAGWKLYADLTGGTPNQHRQVDGKAPIAAMPGDGLTCGYGCGYVGATGIEMTRFYADHFPALLKDPTQVPHAYFYEMGRNYFTFGNKHDAFTTGFAVFMRYVCMDTLALHDTDTATRKVIENAIAEFEATDLPFLRTFTNADGLGEKENRLKSSPTDQPVLYASAMLKLWKSNGDDWLRAFFRNLADCPGADAKTKAGAQAQCFHWYLAASCAAGNDLAPTFIDAWRLELTAAQKTALADVDWKAAKAAELAARAKG